MKSIVKCFVRCSKTESSLEFISLFDFEPQIGFRLKFSDDVPVLKIASGTYMIGGECEVARLTADGYEYGESLAVAKAALEKAGYEVTETKWSDGGQ